MAFDKVKAVKSIPYYARLTRWPENFGNLCGVLGYSEKYPTPDEFVTAVYKWQQAHPPLDADGMLGPDTWERLGPVVQTHNRFTVPPIVMPDWVTSIKLPPWVAKAPTISVPPPHLPRATADLEAKALIDEFFAIKKKRGDSYIAVPVSTAYAIDFAKNSAKVLVSETCGALLPGQVWHGFKGGMRIIIGVLAGVRVGKHDSVGTVVFLTDDGQAFNQPVEGWDGDFQAAVWSGVTEALKPIKLLLDIEAAFLLGAISATGATGFIIAVGGSGLQYVAAHSDDLAKWSIGVGHFLEAHRRLKQYAPFLYDKVIWAIFKRVLGALPESISSDPKIIANFVGTMIVKVGKLILKRDCTVVIDLIRPLAARVVKALGEVGKAAVLPAGGAAVVGTPGAIKIAAKDVASQSASEFVEEMKKLAVTITPLEAVLIIDEIRRNPKEIKAALEQIHKGALYFL